MPWHRSSPKRTALGHKADRAARKRDEVRDAVVRREKFSPSQIIDFLLRPTDLSRNVLKSLTGLSRVDVTRDEVVEKLAPTGHITTDKLVAALARHGKLTPEIIMSISGRNRLNSGVERLIEERARLYEEVLDESKQLVERIASRFTHGTSSLTELEAFGLEVIYYEVLDKYDPDRNLMEKLFESYASLYIDSAFKRSYRRELRDNLQCVSLNEPLNTNENNGEEKQDLLTDPSTPLFHIGEMKEDARLIRETIAQISNEKERKVMELYYLEEADIKDIAQQLKLDYQTAKNLKLRGQLELQYLFWRKKLQQEPQYATQIIDRLESPLLFSECSLRLSNLDALVTKLLDNNPRSQFLRAHFKPESQRKLEDCADANSASAIRRAQLRRIAQRMLIAELNNLLESPILADSQLFGAGPEEAHRLVGQNPKGRDFVLFNRVLLEEAYPEGITSQKTIAQTTRQVWRLYAVNNMETDEIKRVLNIDMTDCVTHLQYGAERLPQLFVEVLSAVE